MSSTSIVKNGEAKPQQVDVRGVDAIYESLALKGDISGLKPAEKVAYYRALCERLNLDPMTQPFLPLRLNNKEILYASRAATDQLARIHSVTREVIARERLDETVYLVKVRASLPSGRAEESIGAVSIAGLKGELLANQLMKCETKGKRRATLAILGLGLLDEIEIETIPKTQVEHLQTYEIQGSSAEAALEAGGASEQSAPVDSDAPPLSDEDREAEERHAALHERLLQEIRLLRDVGVAFTRTQGEMVRLTGKYQRCDLTSEEIEKLISHFADWAKTEAEKLRDQK